MNLIPLPRSVQNRTSTFRLTARTPVIAFPERQPPVKLLGQTLANGMVISPARHACLDIQDNAATHPGQDWIQSYVEVRDGDIWNPLTVLPGLPPDQILGVKFHPSAQINGQNQA